jgi:tetratricopeptide (TPR) repeat protein
MKRIVHNSHSDLEEIVIKISQCINNVDRKLCVKDYNPYYLTQLIADHNDTELKHGLMQMMNNDMIIEYQEYLNALSLTEPNQEEKKLFLLELEGWLRIKSQTNREFTIKKLEEAYTLSQELGKKEFEANFLYLLGWVYFENLKYEESLDYYKQAYELRLTLTTDDAPKNVDSEMIENNAREKAQCLNNMGVVARHQNDFENAEKYHNDALNIRKKLQFQSFSLIAESYINLIDVLSNKGNVDENDFSKALMYAKEALKLINQIYSKKNLMFARLFNHQGTIHFNIAKLRAFSLKDMLENYLEVNSHCFDPGLYKRTKLWNDNLNFEEVLTTMKNKSLPLNEEIKTTRSEMTSNFEEAIRLY